MHKLLLTKPDGRHLTLYGRAEIESGLQAPSPFADPLNASAHLR
jgi:UDPglucose--hexose-1-phosphate uridylyltransferase